MTVRVQHEDFDVAVELAKLRQGRPTVGAVVAFVGTVREMDGGTGVCALELEHYPGMTETALEAIAEQARSRFAVTAITIVHRVGRLHGSDQIVLVAAASQHRSDAFEACAFAMDYLKSEAPFWKKETTTQGTRWVAARASDAAALARWAVPDTAAPSSTPGA